MVLQIKEIISYTLHFIVYLLTAKPHNYTPSVPMISCQLDRFFCLKTGSIVKISLEQREYIHSFFIRTFFMFLVAILVRPLQNISPHDRRGYSPLYYGGLGDYGQTEPAELKDKNSATNQL